MTIAVLWTFLCVSELHHKQKPTLLCSFLRFLMTVAVLWTFLCVSELYHKQKRDLSHSIVLLFVSNTQYYDVFCISRAFRFLVQLFRSASHMICTSHFRRNIVSSSDPSVVNWFFYCSCSSVCLPLELLQIVRKASNTYIFCARDLVKRFLRSGRQLLCKDRKTIEKTFKHFSI